VAPPRRREDDCQVPRHRLALQEGHVRRLQDALGAGEQPSVVHFLNVDFQNVDFQSVEFQNVDFQNVDFQNVDFQNVDIPNVDF
jgi:uncharacterized protein YjbI with pentapeptide repeats